MALLEAKVGPVVTSTSLTPTLQTSMRLGAQGGDLIVSELMPKYYEQTKNGNVFFGANSTGVTTSVGTTTTYVGLVLSNPIGNTKNIVVLKTGYAMLVVNAAASAIGLMTGYSATVSVAHTTPLVPSSCIIGTGPTPTAKLDSVSTTLSATPVVHSILSAGLTGAITTVPQVVTGLIDLDGTIILPPGAFVAYHTSTASGASSFWGSFTWMELPL
jgi:hypothetical protein